MIKALLVSISFATSFLMPHGALAATKISDVSVKRTDAGVAIDISLDKNTSAKTLKPIFERNFVQFVLKSTKIDAAKMISVSESEVQKVFTYPYSPEVARVRVILKGENDWAKNRVSVWNQTSKVVRIFLKDPKNDLAEKSAPSIKHAPLPEVAQTTEVGSVSAVKKTTDESALIKEVVEHTNEIDINNPDSVKAALARPTVSAPTQDAGPVGSKVDPSKQFIRMALALFGIVGLFLGCVFLLHRYSGKFKKLPFGKKERLIQVVATHYLGNKKNISLVKITGEYMVVGVSNDGISLISKLGPEVNVDRYLEDRFWGGTFEKHLDSYAKDNTLNKAVDLGPAQNSLLLNAKSYDGPRDIPAVSGAEKTVDRVELSHVRASIKEKLNKLKPL